MSVFSVFLMQYNIYLYIVLLYRVMFVFVTKDGTE